MVFRNSTVADSAGSKAWTEDVLSVDMEVSANRRLADSEGVAKSFGAKLDSGSSQGLSLG